MKAFFFDADGTLLPKYHQSVPESTLTALHQLRKNGNKLVLCTGRGPQELYFTDFPFDGYILLNGQLCLDENFDPYYENPISGTDKDELLRLFDSCRVPVVLTEKDQTYMNFHNDLVMEISVQISIPPHPVGIWRGGDIFMASVYSSDEIRIGALRTGRWHEHGFDVFPDGGGKQRGIQEFIRKYGIKQEDTIAFGDAENDNEMLQFAGIGIAMGNAYESTKAAADFVTDNSEQDGIDKALNQLKLI